MRRDVENQIYKLGGGDIVNKSEVARRLGCSWKTVDRKINPEKYNKNKKEREYHSKLDAFKELILTKVDTYSCTAKSIFILLKNKIYMRDTLTIIIEIFWDTPPSGK